VTRDLNSRDLALVLIFGALALLASWLVFQNGTQASASVGAVGPGETVPLAATDEAPQPAEPAAAQAPAPKQEPEVEPEPDPGTQILEVQDGATVTLHDSPGGDVIAELGSETEFGGPTVLTVAERRGAWAGVPTHLVDNGELAWVRVDSPGLATDSVGLEIVVDLSEMRGRLLRDGEVEHSWQVSIGAPESPTPTGRFSITDVIVGGLNPVYGCCAMAHSATQPNLPPGWTGGNRMAIHGSTEAIGAANSSGCVRSGEEDLQLLVDRVPVGTPVLIKD
jgi:lipoprotein-anchoring transpeptidase ErfK/SrfK